MKKIKLMSLLTVLCLLFGNIVYSQGDPQPLPQNTITRVLCPAGFLGCTNDAIDLKLSSSFISSTGTFTGSSTHTYATLQTKIKITITGTSLTSTGTYYLPTTVGDQTIIPSTDGILPYTVFIKKTGTQQFTLEVSKISL
jgi:hypothetical protein